MLQLERCDEHTEEDPASKLAGDHIGMLAHPAKTCAHRPLLFQDRPGVDEPARLGGGLDCPDILVELLQLLWKDLVVVPAPCVTADLRTVGLSLVRRIVVACNDDHRACRWKQLADIPPLLDVPLHPLHRAIVAAQQPLLVAHSLLLHDVRRRKADKVEAELVEDVCAQLVGQRRHGWDGGCRWVLFVVCYLVFVIPGICVAVVCYSISRNPALVQEMGSGGSGSIHFGRSGSGFSIRTVSPSILI